MTHYSNLLKEWRKRRRLSQLDLAVEAEVSARHISFLETGRSRPSADMIVHLSEVMNVPLSARNQMMHAAGFAPRYSAKPLTDEAMSPIREAVSWTLRRHAPYPGIVLDRIWNIVQMNTPATRLFAPLGLAQGESLLALLQNPILPNVIENWPEVAYYTSLRLKAESTKAGGIPELDQAIAYLEPIAQIPDEEFRRPSIPTTYRFGSQRLSLFGTLAHFSTVTDETLEDLRVELFFPADDESAALLHSLDHGQT